MFGLCGWGYVSIVLAQCMQNWNSISKQSAAQSKIKTFHDSELKLKQFISIKLIIEIFALSYTGQNEKSEWRSTPMWFIKIWTLFLRTIALLLVENTPRVQITTTTGLLLTKYNYFICNWTALCISTSVNMKSSKTINSSPFHP